MDPSQVGALDLSGCGDTKGCYTRPSDCTEDCDLAVTWIPNGNGFDFEMSSKADYVALGFSQDESMVNWVAFVSRLAAPRCRTSAEWCKVWHTWLH